MTSATKVRAERVATVRSFNRFFTEVIGVLDEGFLHTPYSLTEARVIFELAQVESLDFGSLRQTLGLDAGYLSRILARFESDGLVTRERSTADRRRQVVRLTPDGKATFKDLDERSAGETRTLLDRLDQHEQHQLISSMESIRALLADSPPERQISLRGPRPGDFGWVVERHGELYAREYGWNANFERLVAHIVADYLGTHDAEREAVWIAEVDSERAGCIFCVAKDERTAQLRLLLAEPWARGLGVGRRLVDECIAFARSAGYAELGLWTNDVLVAARRIYERAGFKLVDEERHNDFGPEVVGQSWTLKL